MDKNIDVKSLFMPMLRTIYLSGIEKIPSVLSRKLLAANESMKRGSGKLNGNIDVLFCLYDMEGVERVVSEMGSRSRVLILPRLTSRAGRDVLNSYFTGYEGITEELYQEVRDEKKSTRNEKILFSKEFIRIFEKYYVIFRNIINEHNVKAVFLTGLVGVYESALIQLAFENKIKVFYCPHGNLACLFQDKKHLENVYVFASGKEERDTLLKSGIKPGNIFVTGSPFFDNISNYRIKGKESRRKAITILTQPMVEDGDMSYGAYFGFVKNLLDEISKVKGYRVVIKLHPREKYKNSYEAICRKAGLDADVIQSSDKDSLYNILSKSCLAIGFGSTSEIEALMLGKAVLTINLKNQKARPFYTRFVMKVEKDHVTADIIRRALSDRIIRRELGKKRQDYIRKFFYKIDGHASVRVARIIRKMVQE